MATCHQPKALPARCRSRWSPAHPARGEEENYMINGASMAILNIDGVLLTTSLPAADPLWLVSK
jgi:hypothetical protein